MRKPTLLLLLGAFTWGGLTPVSAQRDDKATEKADDKVVDLERFVVEDKLYDPSGIMDAMNKPINSAFGFDKPLVETPRAITIVSSQQLESVGIRNSEDLVKVAPGTFSNFRFGLQGNVSIRNQTSDFYFRGMRRLDPQGNFRTVWSANESLEIIRGPASPIYGLGRIGGYVNFSPKTGRVSTGKEKMGSFR